MKKTNYVEDKEYVITCIFCGEPVDPDEAVRFEGFISHPGCAASTRERRIKQFDTTLFSIGAIGALIGVLMSIPLLLNSNYTTVTAYGINIYDWQSLALSYTGIAVGLVIQSIGLISFNRNFTQREALAAFLLSLVTAAASGMLAVLLLTYGPNPDFHDPVEGFLLIGDIPEFFLTLVSFGFLFGITSILVGVTIWMLEKELANIGAPPLLLAFVFIFIGGVLALVPLAPILYFGLIMYVYASIGMPSYWKDKSTPVK